MREEYRITGWVFAFVAGFVLAAMYLGGIGGANSVWFLLNGLQAAAIFVLLALGLSLIFGMAGVINFAHGAIFMVGAYATWFVTSLGYSYLTGVLFAIVVTALLGLTIEITGLRRLYDENVLLQVLYTFGLAIALEGLMLLLVGPAARSVATPAWGAGSVPVLGVEYPAFRLIIVLVTVVLVLGVWTMLQRTDIGLIIRAGTRDTEMVQVLGINVQRMFTFVFVVGSALAGIAGSLIAPTQNLTPGMGNNIIIDTFVVVVVGGLGSFFGTILGGISVAQILTFGGFYPFVERYQETMIFAFMALVLLVRPRGFLGRIGLYEE